MPCVPFDIILDYVRMTSYALVILTSLRGIYKRKFTNALYIGDVVLSISLFSTLLFRNFLGSDLDIVADLFITPASILWAVLHLRELVRYSNGNALSKIV